MNLNRKGFTLIELLVTIVIIGFVLSFMILGITKILQISGEKQQEMLELSIKNAMQIYIKESESVVWTDIGDEQQFCLTVGNLMNAGFIDKAKIENSDNDIGSGTFVIAKKNKITQVIEKIEITNEEDLCNF